MTHPRAPEVACSKGGRGSSAAMIFSIATIVRIDHEFAHCIDRTDRFPNNRSPFRRKSVSVPVFQIASSTCQQFNDQVCHSRRHIDTWGTYDMSSPHDKGKQKEKPIAAAIEENLTEAERKKRSFERSLAGPSVGKAGLIRDQTGESYLDVDDHS